MMMILMMGGCHILTSNLFHFRWLTSSAYSLPCTAGLRCSIHLFSLKCPPKTRTRTLPAVTCPKRNTKSMIWYGEWTISYFAYSIIIIIQAIKSRFLNSWVEQWNARTNHMQLPKSPNPLNCNSIRLHFYIAPLSMTLCSTVLYFFSINSTTRPQTCKPETLKISEPLICVSTKSKSSPSTHSRQPFQSTTHAWSSRCEAPSPARLAADGPVRHGAPFGESRLAPLTTSPWMSSQVYARVCTNLSPSLLAS